MNYRSGMAQGSNAVTALVARYFSRLRFPQLLVILLVVLAIDLVVPDPIPFVDEILLALGALLLGSLRKRPGAEAE